MTSKSMHTKTTKNILEKIEPESKKKEKASFIEFEGKHHPFFSVSEPAIIEII